MALATPGPGSGPSRQYGYSYMQAAVLTRQAADRASTSPRKELQMYLEAPLVDVEDIVAWWGVSSSINPTFLRWVSIANSLYSNTQRSIRRLHALQGTISPSRVLQSPPNARSPAVA
jgi:hypothetical protein